MKIFWKNFTSFEKYLWFGSMAGILVTFAIFDRENILSFCASLIGVTALIFNAKGNPFGQVLIIIFSFIYGYISLTFQYYGEMITYLGMSAPMALVALIAWLKHPFKGQRSQVAVHVMKPNEYLFMSMTTIAVTVIFYFILLWLNTANLIVSTVSVTTSFAAAYLTYKRSPYFALAYAANDIVLIALWIMATIADFTYFSVIICFVVFLVNDLYGFFNWLKMQKKQQNP